MVNIMIVDDDVWTVKRLCHAVDRESLGVDQVFCAYGMEEAQEIFQKEMVDVLLCDIEMPGGSGLDLLEWVNQRELDTVTMFLTSHADFHYAQRAIGLQSLSYLLKPIPDDKLNEVLSKAVRVSLEKSRPRRKEVYEGTQDAIHQVVDYIQANLEQNVGREEIAAHVSLNSDYLSRYFKKEMGISLIQYINDVKMEKAKDLLANTNVSIGNIAQMVGFSHFSHFSSKFKKHTLMSPVDYRKKYLQN